MYTNRTAKGPLFPERLVDPESVGWASGRSRGFLPHLEKAGCSYFVTFCLRDATGRRTRPDDDTPESIAVASEPAQGGPWRALQKPPAAQAVENALLHFQGDRYLLSAWVVMPDHVHTVVTPLPGWKLGDLLHSWKSFSAKQINTLFRRTGSVWQREAFDHLIRRWDSFDRFVAYTEHNPVEAGLCDRPEHWPFSSARFQTNRI